MSNKIDFKKLAEPFDPKEIDWRIGRAGGGAKPWASVLAYIDARAVMDRLDEVVGPDNWKDRYWKETGGDMCGLSIRVNGEWVEKVDGSDQTDIEAFKGGISKALVRAAVKWGIGRYLYSLGDGRAQIVSSNTDGARWQGEKANGKYPSQNHNEFHWLPPVLPDWALPESKFISASEAEALRKIGGKVRITPEAAKAILSTFGYASSNDVEKSKYEEVVKKFEEWKPVSLAK